MSSRVLGTLPGRITILSLHLKAYYDVIQNGRQKSKLCIVLPIPDRISQFFFYFIHFRGHWFRICKENYQKATVNLSKDHNIYFFIDFLMHWAIKREDMYLEHYSWRFSYNGLQWSIRLIWFMYMNIWAHKVWFIRLLIDSTVRMQTVMQITHWYVKEHTARGLHEINVDKPAGQNH